MDNSNVGDAPDAQGRTQANRIEQSSRAQQDKLQHAQMQRKTNPFKGGGEIKDHLVGDKAAVSADHNRPTSHNQRSTQSHNLQRSVESVRVAGGGGGSLESRQSDVVGVFPVADQGAAAEYRGSITVVRGNYATAAKK